MSCGEEIESDRYLITIEEIIPATSSDSSNVQLPQTFTVPSTAYNTEQQIAQSLRQRNIRDQQCEKSNLQNAETSRGRLPGMKRKKASVLFIISYSIKY